MKEEAPSCHSGHLKYLQLKSALLAMEPPDCIISLARKAGFGLLTEDVQSIILEICNSSEGGSCNLDNIYIKGILKKLITDAEFRGEVVIEGAYERYAHYMSSMQDYDSSKLTRRVVKHISFLFCEVSHGTWSISEDFVIPIQCSLNMLEGDTGCAIWPSSLFLSEFILSYPNLFCKKKCFEVGSGTGLVGIALQKVNASQESITTSLLQIKVVVSDGDPSSLMNLRFNLKLNGVGTEDESKWASRSTTLLSNHVMCKYLPWEEANETMLQGFLPDIVLGADVIYNPSCVPHLVRILAILLSKKQSECQDEGRGNTGNCSDVCDGESSLSKNAPVAYIAVLIRNIRTFDLFLKLIEESHLTAVDITDSNKPYCLLPYMLSYDRSNVRLYKVTISCN